jgi:NADPH-dependent 2,4-dienoyl-CoA reductase/sulfur reductase-like enzyme
MECALNAAQRGHTVLVLEKSERVGGQVWVGASSPLRKSWARIAEFYERQSRKGQFEVRLNTAADTQTILALEPEVVVIATGSRPKRMEIPGGPAAFTVHEALAGKCDGARQVVVYDNEGFNRPGVAADYLSSRGITVHYITPQTRLSITGDGMMLEEMTVRLQERGVVFSLGEAILGWEEPGALRLQNLLEPAEGVLSGVDAVVAAIGSETESALAEALRGRIPELHVIGDAVEPKTVEQATVQGATLARAL